MASVKTFPPLRGEDLRHWIAQEATHRGVTLSPKAVWLLSETVGSDLWAMANELEKLILLSQGGEITPELVQKIVPQAQQANVFRLVDAILEKRPKQAGALLHQLLARGVPAAVILFHTGRRLHLLVQAKALLEEGIKETELKARLNLTQGFALRRTQEQARRYSWPRLKGLYHQLMETDLAIKTGKQEEEVALELLVAGITQGAEGTAVPK